MCKEMFTKEKFQLGCEHPEVFTRCYWQKSPHLLPIWIAYRVLVLLYFFLLLMMAVFYYETGTWYKQLIYAHRWLLKMQVVVFSMALAMVVKRFLVERENPELPPMEKMPMLYKVMWAVYCITASNSIVVSIIYWISVYSPETESNLAFVTFAHAINCLFMILDFALSAFPYRFVHFYLPLSGALVYCVFSVIYQLSGGTGIDGIPIYEILDWREPKIALMTWIIYLLSVSFVHTMFCIGDIIKHWMKKSSEGE